MRRSILTIWVFACLAFGCEADSDSPDPVDAAAPDSEIPADPDVVVVGFYEQADDGTYVDLGFEIAFEVGVTCFTWTRTAPADRVVDSEHLHHNAADATAYTDGTFSWTEYGPEHSADDIDTVCAAGEGGVEKSVNAADYLEDHPGLFLRIKRLE